MIGTMLRNRYVVLNIKLDPDEKYSEFSSHESVNWFCSISNILYAYFFFNIIYSSNWKWKTFDWENYECCCLPLFLWSGMSCKSKLLLVDENCLLSFDLVLSV